MTSLTFSDDLLTLTVSNIALSSSGDYYITVSNEAGAVSGLYTLEVQSKLVLLTSGNGAAILEII